MDIIKGVSWFTPKQKATKEEQLQLWQISSAMDYISTVYLFLEMLSWVLKTGPNDNGSNVTNT